MNTSTTNSSASVCPSAHRGVSRLVKAIACGTALITVSLSGCSDTAESPRAYVARVNGEKIYLRDYTGKLQRALKLSAGGPALGPSDLNRLREEVLDGLINEKIMLARARELSLFVSDEELTRKIREIKKDYPDNNFTETLASRKIDYGVWREEMRKNLLLEKLIAADVYARVSVTEEEGQAYFQKHAKEYRAEQKVHVAQIIVRDRGKADAALKRLRKGEDFSQVARDTSIGPEAPLGGDLGFVGRGVMPETIEKSIFSLSPGEISRVVKSPFGYHIFKLLARDEGGRKKFPEVKDRILADIRSQKEEQEYTGWLVRLRSKAAIERNEEVLKKVLLPAPPAANH